MKKHTQVIYLQTRYRQIGRLLIACYFVIIMLACSGSSNLSNITFNSSANGNSGALICAGYAINLGPERPVFAALTSSGTIQTSFGSNGSRIVPISRGSFAQIIHSASGSFIAGGLHISGVGHSFLARASSTGTLETSFGTSGYETYIFDDGSVVTDLIETTGNAIIACGYKGTDGTLRAFAFKTDANGAIDTGWGTSGQITLVSSASRARSIHDTGSGTALITGTTDSGSLFAIQLDASGAPDAAYGTGGTTTIPITDLASGGVSAWDDSGFLYLTATTTTGQLIITKLNSSGNVIDTFTHQLREGLAVYSALTLNNQLYLGHANNQISQITSFDTTTGNVLETFDFGSTLSDDALIPLRSMLAGDAFLPLPFGLSVAASGLAAVGTLGPIAFALKTDTGLLADLTYGMNGLAFFTEIPQITVPPSQTNYLFVYNTDTQAVTPASTWIDITWDSLGQTDGSWSIVSSKTFVCPEAGKYKLSYTLQYHKNAILSGGMVATRIVSDGSELLGTQAAFSKSILDEVSKALSRDGIYHLTEGAELTLQHRSSSTTFELEPLGVGDEPISGVFTITRVE